MTTKLPPRNPISDLPRHAQGAMLEALLGGYTQVPTVYVIETDPLRFVYLQPNGNGQAPIVKDCTAVIEGIMGGSIPLKDKDFDLQDEIRGLFAYTVNFWPVS